MRTHLTIVLGLLVALGCGGTKKFTQDIPPPPQKEEIEAHIQLYEKAKKNGVPLVGVMVYRDAIHIAVDLWRNFGMCEVRRAELEAAKNLDLEVAAGTQAQAEADRDKALRDRWLWLAVGVAVGTALGVGTVVLSF